MNKEENKFIVTDVTDVIVIGGFGNDKGNIDLLKYSEEQITNMIMENNDNDDNIRLTNSLLGTMRNQQQRIDKLIETFEKEIEKLKEKRRMIMTILTPENGYLKADVEFEIERLERYLEILKGDVDE